MTKILFIDDHADITRGLWIMSGCPSDENLELLPTEEVDSVERACEMVRELRPDIILIDYYFKDGFKGSDVVKALRKEGYKGKFVGNTHINSMKDYINDGVGDELSAFVGWHHKTIRIVLNYLSEKEKK